MQVTVIQVSALELMPLISVRPCVIVLMSNGSLVPNGGGAGGSPVKALEASFYIMKPNLDLSSACYLKRFVAKIRDPVVSITR